VSAAAAVPGADSSGAAKPKGKSKLLVIIVAMVVVLGGAGAAAWFMLGNKQASAGHVEEAPAAKRSSPTYLALENMVVNLADPGGEKVAQIGITLDLDGDKTVDQVKTLLPKIRSGLLILISQRTSEELLKRDGKEKLAADVVTEVAQTLGYEVPKRKARKGKVEEDGDGEVQEPVVRNKARAAGPVNGVLFSSFIVQ
jgi:flagellar FliL protein